MPLGVKALATYPLKSAKRDKVGAGLWVVAVGGGGPAEGPWRQARAGCLSARERQAGRGAAALSGRAVMGAAGKESTCARELGGVRRGGVTAALATAATCCLPACPKRVTRADHRRHVLLPARLPNAHAPQGLRDVPVSFAGVTVKPGDWVYADKVRAGGRLRVRVESRPACS